MFDPTRASLRSRLAQKAPLGAFWMSLGSASVVEIAASARPDAIVIDVDLPDESGWLSAAKILLVQPSQRIILLADSFDANERERARSLGVVGMVRREDGMGDLTALVVNRQVSVAV